MKKLLPVLLVLLLGICAQANASIVQIWAEDDLDINVLGFGVDIIAPLDAVKADFALDKGVLPSATWDVWIAANPKLGIQAVDYFASTGLAGGLIATVQSGFDFTLDIDSFIVAGTGGAPYSADLYDIVPGISGDILTYTISNPVPIPSAFLLLGGGLLGLVGIRRKAVK